MLHRTLHLRGCGTKWEGAKPATLERGIDSLACAQGQGCISLALLRHSQWSDSRFQEYHSHHGLLFLAQLCALYPNEPPIVCCQGGGVKPAAAVATVGVNQYVGRWQKAHLTCPACIIIIVSPCMHLLPRGSHHAARASSSGSNSTVLCKQHAACAGSTHASVLLALATCSSTFKTHASSELKPLVAGCHHPLMYGEQRKANCTIQTRSHRGTSGSSRHLKRAGATGASTLQQHVPEKPHSPVGLVLAAHTAEHRHAGLGPGQLC